MTLSQLAAFLPAALLVAVSPGANNLLAFSHGTRAGFGPSVASLGGRFAAFALMIVAVAFGLGAVLESSELAFATVKWLGVAYLAWLGLRLFRSRELPVAADGSGGARADVGALARREFTVAVTNPKASLLFTAFLPQFVLGDEPFVPQLLMLGIVYIGVEFAAACGYAGGGALVRRVDMTPARARTLNRTSGTMMFGAAALLAFTKRE